MNDSYVRASVVVCAYTMERFDDVCRTIESVQSQTQAPAEIVVAVDHNEELAGLLEGRWGSVAPVVRNAGVRGLSATRNVGSAATSGEILAFIDDDAAADPDWLLRLTAAFEDPAVVAVGGGIRPAWATGGRPRWLAPEFDWVVACTYRGMPVSANGDVRNVIGANMAFRRSALGAVGWFSPGLGRVGRTTGQAEETEICIRMRQQIPGARILYEPRALVHHKVPAERLTLRFLLKRSYNEGFYKARMQRRLPRGSRPLASEAAYAKHLALRFVPQELLRLYDLNSVLRLGSAAFSVSAVLLGTIIGRARPEA